MITTSAVVLGLVFVGLELRQNTIAVSAATYDRLASSSTFYLHQMTENSEVADLMGRIYSGAKDSDLTPTEWYRVKALEIAFLMHLQNSFRQYQAGVVGADIFESYGWNDDLLWAPHFTDAWPSDFDDLFDDEFVKFLSQHIDQRRAQD